MSGDSKNLFRVTNVSNDSRGKIFELDTQQNLHINFMTIKKGRARGGHSHEYLEGFFLISGRVEFHSGTLQNDQVKIHTSGDVIMTIPNEPHYLLALEDSVVVELRPKGTIYTAHDYEPFRSIVLRLMKLSSI